MDTLELLRQLAIILISAKLLGLLVKLCKTPQVIGQIIAGLIIGPSLLGLVEQNDFLSGMAEIGVILLMFSAGLETNIQQLKKTGVKATVIACAGVGVPLILGTILFMCFYGFATPGTEQFTKALFVGTILTATSVSITVQVLKELRKLDSFTGTTIVSAAIIDDVIGIVVLTAVLSLKDPSNNLWMVIIKTAAFFLLASLFGYFIYRIMKVLDRRYPRTPEISIFGLVFAFALSYIADKYFGVADITGAYMAGIILSSLDDSDYIDRKIDVNSYMIFAPLFFAGIGIGTNLHELDTTILFFSLAFVAVGLGAKIIGCGCISKLCGFDYLESLKIGVGMMTRGEVALIITQRGLKLGILSAQFSTSVILLIIVSSIATPITLKILYYYNAKK